MSGQKSKSTVPKSTVSAATSRTTTSDATQPRRRMVQNYLVIWVDGNIDENTEDCRNTLAQLRAAVIEVNVCTTPEGCIEFLNEMDDGKAFIISSGALGQHLVADIHSMPKVDAIYIFCGNKARHESWAKDWPKIRGVFTSIKPICESLKKVANECDHDSTPMRVNIFLISPLSPNFRFADAYCRRFHFRRMNFSLTKPFADYNVAEKMFHRRYQIKNMSPSTVKECSICETPLGNIKKKVVTTNCGHTFHRDCAQERLDKRHKGDCRVCHQTSALTDALRIDQVTPIRRQNDSTNSDEETADAYSKLKNEDWKCKCSVRNKASRDKCMSCQQPRPSPSSDSYAAAAEVIEEKRGKRPSSSAKYQDYHDSDDHESAKNNQMLHKQQKIQSGGLHFETLVTDIPLKFNNLN
ncbi:unnamed protein product [Rotaria magnacalcarata]|uniref:RING-type domain-containing protein n=2 Tax=Rotaria magnacalcarata TaxID=392030 RepID=A0A819H4L4_9BILA|nr:unnamed protein product [Rotaria magnacalcarata]